MKHPHNIRRCLTYSSECNYQFKNHLHINSYNTTYKAIYGYKPEKPNTYMIYKICYTRTEGGGGGGHQCTPFASINSADDLLRRRIW